MPKKPTTHTIKPKDRLLPRLSLAFFDRPKLTFVIWLVLVVFGATSYLALLKHEGFPSVNIPLAIVNGTYSPSPLATWHSNNPAFPPYKRKAPATFIT
jgi:hypothetical protein